MGALTLFDNTVVNSIFVYTMVSALGVCFGSFSNVCILRIPEKQSINGRSQCVSCGRKLRWYELIPIFSFLALRGRCLGCKSRISPQYPLIEGACGILWLLVCLVTLRGSSGIPLHASELYGILAVMFLRCLMATALLIVAAVDIRTMEIPPELNAAIVVLGLIMAAIDYQNWYHYLIGAISVSGVLLILWLVTNGRALGGGDIKLMAACGLFLGWKLIILAFLLGCVIGSVIHLIRMFVAKADRVLAFGPYLALGVYISMLCGNTIINWYLKLFSSI